MRVTGTRELSLLLFAADSSTTSRAFADMGMGALHNTVLCYVLCTVC